MTVSLWSDQILRTRHAIATGPRGDGRAAESRRPTTTFERRLDSFEHLCTPSTESHHRATLHHTHRAIIASHHVTSHLRPPSNAFGGEPSSIAPPRRLRGVEPIAASRSRSVREASHPITPTSQPVTSTSLPALVHNPSLPCHPQLITSPSLPWHFPVTPSSRTQSHRPSLPVTPPCRADL